MTENQNPEQQARDRIDAQLRQAGWVGSEENRLLRRHRAGRTRMANRCRPGRLRAVRRPQGRRRHRSQARGRRPAPHRARNRKPKATPPPNSNGSITRSRCPSSTKPPASSPALPMAATPSRVRVKSSASTARKPCANGCRKATACAPASPPAAAQPRASAGQRTPPARLPGNRHHRPGAILPRSPAARPDPDGHRRRQDLHRHHQHLPPAQTRQRQARALPGRYQKPRRAGRAGNDGLCAQRR